MSFIRPAAQAKLWQWREALIGGALALSGFWWIIGPGGLLRMIGILFVLAGFALIVAGFQRARFRAGNDGPGIVSVDEGQISYFGPLSGGMVATREMDRLSLDPTAKPAHWILQQYGQPDLAIPVNAMGADALFDAFATLPGLQTQRMLQQLQSRANHPVVIWSRLDQPSHHPRLH